MGLMQVWGILLQNVPQVNSLQFSGCYWLLQNALWSGIPGPSQPYTLIGNDPGQFAYLGILKKW